MGDLSPGLGCTAIVLGGGVIGASAALELAQHGIDVTLVEAKDQLGLGTTSAAIGGITPQSETWCRGPLRHVATWSTELYRPFLTSLEEVSGVEVPLLETGQLQVALSDEQMLQITDDLVPQWDTEGFTSHVLDRAATLEAEPLLSERLVGSVLLPIEVALEPARLMEAITRCLDLRSEAVVRYGTTATMVDACSTHARVDLDDGTQLLADYVVVATGVDATRLLPDVAAGMYPMKGQATEFSVISSGYALNHHVYAANGGPRRSAYIVPRKDGRVVGGVTYQPNDASLNTVEDELDQVYQGLAELCPAALSWTRGRSWAGVRPASRDGRPFIGFVDRHHRVIACVGHQGLGVTLAPATSQLVAQLIWNGTAQPDARIRTALEICDPLRPIPGDVFDWSGSGAAA